MLLGDNLVEMHVPERTGDVAGCIVCAERAHLALAHSHVPTRRMSVSVCGTPRYFDCNMSGTLGNSTHTAIKFVCGE
jgi:hypothetical protein